jgi:hypothetical protein
MEYLILALVLFSFSLLLALHPDIIRWGNKYRQYIYRTFPLLRQVDAPMKTALTLSCLILFAGIIVRIFLTEDRWLLNAIGFAFIPPLVQWSKKQLRIKKN